MRTPNDPFKYFSKGRQRASRHQSLGKCASTRPAVCLIQARRPERSETASAVKVKKRLRFLIAQPADYNSTTMERVVDIGTDGLHLAADRGFLTVNASGAEKGRIALDDVGALIVHAHGTTWSNTL
jgi:hypothetical protein